MPILVWGRLRLQGLHESELRAAAQVRVSIRAPRGAVAELCLNRLDGLATRMSPAAKTAGQSTPPRQRPEGHFVSSDSWIGLPTRRQLLRETADYIESFAEWTHFAVLDLMSSGTRT